jgi:DNA-binding transcriptional LysR family regulator
MTRPHKRRRDGDGRLRPSIDSLRVFVELGDRIKAAADQGSNFASLNEAAASMSSAYSKSNVFRALEELRKLYRRQLVNRKTVSLSAEGETVYSWATDLLEMHGRGRKWPIGAKEQVHIGTSNWILNFILPEIVRVFLKERATRKRKDKSVPDVDLVFGEYDVENLLVDLRKGTLQAGLAAVFAAGSWPELDAVILRHQVATVMIAASRHERWGKEPRKHRQEVSLAELAEEKVCVLNADLYRLLPGLPEPRAGGCRILVKNYASVVSLVRAGPVVGFVPHLDMTSELNPSAYQGLELYHIKDDVPLRTLAILRRRHEELPEEVEAFLRIVQEKLR